MNFNLISNIETCFNLVRDTVNVPLIYYSHIPTSIISLGIGFFVFRKTKNNIGKVLLAICIAFSLWTVCSFVTWTSYDSRMYMFFWSFFGILTALIYILSAYFSYIFLFNKDASQVIKIIAVILLLPIILLTPTTFDIQGFDLTWCIATENPSFMWYYYMLGLASFLLIIFSGIKKYIKTADKIERKKSLLFTIGIGAFILSFWFTSFLASYLSESGLVPNYNLEPYGLFGMTVFMGFLAYLIVKYKAFDIKMIAAQALVAFLIILIASQFAFIENSTNKILTGITLVLSVIGGYVLVKSVQLEVQRKEQLQEMTDKLSVANDKLRTLDNAKSEFISIASHQLRTPLTAVKGYASLLLEGSYGKLNEKHRDVLNKMYQSNERLIMLVEDMLNLSRIESGRMEYKFEKIALDDVLQEIYDTFVLRAKENNLKLELVRSERPLPVVTTDRNKIREIISNFTDNAIKYTPSGGVKMTAFEKNGKVVVAITDTGIGIPKDEMPYLFEKFSRGKDTSRLNAGGTGLGLHVGVKMIQELKGRIWVESEGAGKGSTFFVELPVG